MSLPAEKLDASEAVPPAAGEPNLPAELPLTVIEARSGWRSLDLDELWRFRELIYFFAWRDVKVRYKQTALGAAWAILQPTLMMAVFTLVLGRMAHVPAGDLPYPLFAYAGLLPWTFFATAITGAGQSVVYAERLVGKVYFPRLAIPLAAMGPALVDFALASVVLGVLMAWYGVAPRWTLLLVPAFMALLLVIALGIGTLLAALNVAYRDVRHALPFLVQLWLFATPSVYLDTSASAAAPDHQPAADHAAPETVRPKEPLASSAEASSRPSAGPWTILRLNPIDGIIACLRAAALGGPIPWPRLVYPAIIAPLLLAAGCYYFRRVEDSFADIL
jgi:lipopolysaccharide transport system permease protein